MGPLSSSLGAQKAEITWKNRPNVNANFRRNPAELTGPTATVILSRYTVALHSVALRFPGFGGVWQENRATPPQNGPVVPTFSALKGGVALEVASWKVLQYRGASQLHCRLSRYSGSLSCGKPLPNHDVQVNLSGLQRRAFYGPMPV